jgi:hypothetical protein
MAKQADLLQGTLDLMGAESSFTRPAARLWHTSAKPTDFGQST